MIEDTQMYYREGLWDGFFLMEELYKMPAKDKLEIFGTSVFDKILEEYLADEIINIMNDYMDSKPIADVGDIIEDEEGNICLVTAIDNITQSYYGVDEEGVPQVWDYNEPIILLDHSNDAIVTIYGAFEAVGAYGTDE